MKTVMVSGCYDVLHAGHVRFFEDAKTLGDRLVVCVASDSAIRQHKARNPALPEDSRRAIVEALKPVDAAIVSSGHTKGLDFHPEFLEVKPDILAVTSDDRYKAMKRELCRDRGVQYICLPKTCPDTTPISATEIRQRIAAPRWTPLRVDFAGGWLDVPKLAIEGGRVVNLAVTPGASLDDWWLPDGSGLGGSAAKQILTGTDAVTGELLGGAGWQDPAILMETGLCVWASGAKPSLISRDSGQWLSGHIGLEYVKGSHLTSQFASKRRDYDMILQAGLLAEQAVMLHSVARMMDAVRLSHDAQVDEGMEPLEQDGVARKYCGTGWGGYVLVVGYELPNCKRIEPYCRWENRPGQTSKQALQINAISSTQ